MSRKWLLISALFCLLLSYSCSQTLQPDNPVKPITVMDGTPYDNPMAMIELFAKQTAVAQTEIANPYHPSLLDVAQTPPAFSADKKILYVVFSGGRRVGYNPLELASFPQVTVSVGDQEAKGVSLLTLLDQAGWGTYDTVAVSLKGIGSLTIPKERIGEDFVLVFTGSSLRFISHSIPENMWIEGITIIEVY
jgi:hypothetical protein